MLPTCSKAPFAAPGPRRRWSSKGRPQPARVGEHRSLHAALQRAACGAHARERGVMAARLGDRGAVPRLRRRRVSSAPLDPSLSPTPFTLHLPLSRASCFSCLPPHPTPSPSSVFRVPARCQLSRPARPRGLGTRALHAEGCWRRLRRRRRGRQAFAERAGLQPGRPGLGPDPSASRARRSDRAGHCPLRPKTARARQGLGGLSRARLTAPAPPHPSHVWACPEAGPALANGRDSVSRRHSVSLQRHGDTL